MRYQNSRNIFFMVFASVLFGFLLMPLLSAGEMVVIDTSGFWRVHHTLRVPTRLVNGALERMPTEIIGKKAFWVEKDTPPPPQDWIKPEFDDSKWLRIAGMLAARPLQKPKNDLDPKSMFVGLECLRTRFGVTDKAKIKGLILSLQYRGGVVVFLNGTEIARGHLKKGEGDRLSQLAEPSEGGQVERSLQIEVSTASLVDGVNVLALECHHAPYREDEMSINDKKWPQGISVKKALCGIDSIRLTVPESGVAAVSPNIARPKGLQVWNSDVMNPDFDLDWGDPFEPLKPIRIAGACNGAFTGKIVVGSDREIRGLKATVGDLKCAGGIIPASAVRISYGMPDGKEVCADMRYLAEPDRMDILDTEAPEVVAVAEKKPGRYSLKSEGIQPVFGAVCPIWVKVRIPADSKGGVYGGTLTVSATGEKPIEVPVRVRVSAWNLPAPNDYATYVELIQSPETLALAYEAPLWSDKHYELIGQSLKYMGDIGNKTAFIHLICETNAGNSESMVRWIEKPGGGYDYDFTIFDRYLDLFEKHNGKPQKVILYLWDTYLDRELGGRTDEKWEDPEQKSALAAAHGKGPEVTLLDPKTGKLSKLVLPEYKDPKAVEMWRPLAEKLMKRMKARGLENSLLLGLMGDYAPAQNSYNSTDKIFPGLKWAIHAHMWPLGKAAAVNGYKVNVNPTDKEMYADPATKRVMGWQEKDIRLHAWRSVRNEWCINTFRLQPEICIARPYRGFARYGADFFQVLKDARGRIQGTLSGRFVKTYWNNLNIVVSLLAQGKKGPVPTYRYEMMREAVQECEARIHIEKAILSGKLPGELAKRCQDLLDERTRLIRRGLEFNWQGAIYEQWSTRPDMYFRFHSPFGSYWYIGSGWQERSWKLYDMAAETSKFTN